MLWRAAAASVSYLTEELRQRQLQYSTIVTGKTERASRWKECIDVTSGRYISDLLRDFKTEPSVQFNDDDENKYVFTNKKKININVPLSQQLKSTLWPD